jgi:ribonuclease VapC
VKRANEIRSVLDASGLLIYLQREPGYERVRAAFAEGTVIGSVNLAEVYAKVVERQLAIDEVAERLRALGLGVVPFTEEDARNSAILYPKARALGLSLADRACLALGLRLRVPVLTADRTWKRLDGVKVELLR